MWMPYLLRIWSCAWVRVGLIIFYVRESQIAFNKNAKEMWWHGCTRNGSSSIFLYTDTIFMYFLCWIGYFCILTLLSRTFYVGLVSQTCKFHKKFVLQFIIQSWRNMNLLVIACSHLSWHTIYLIARICFN